MTTPRIPGHPPPNPVTAFFFGRPLKRGTHTFSETTWRAPAIDPAILEATMTTGGWVSWEMVHFISEIASERKVE